VSGFVKAITKDGKPSALVIARQYRNLGWAKHLRATCLNDARNTFFIQALLKRHSLATQPR
jgi:antitoxin (DNA-binding transcriptional repressor) of toxin-antitoxin stability system